VVTPSVVPISVVHKLLVLYGLELVTTEYTLNLPVAKILL
jgi:hypothetical protein